MLVARLIICSTVQVELCPATCANATLEMFQYKSTDPLKTSKTYIQIVKEQYRAVIRLDENLRLMQQHSCEFGGARRDRTADLLRARQALSQLSYGPQNWWVWEDSNFRPHPYQGCALTN